MTLKELYNNKINIMEYLRNNSNIDFNDKEIIKYSYDLQAGSYIKDYLNPSNNIIHVRQKKNDCDLEEIDYITYVDIWYKAAANILNSLNCSSLLDAGTGEATTLHGILKHSSNQFKQIFGIDISLSRILYASSFFSKNLPFPDLKANFLTGSIFELPFTDSSIDLVFTCHAIEPNTNNEKAILQELYRVAKKYLVLIEPSYNLGSDATKENIVKHKYIRNLHNTAGELGYNIIKYELFDISIDKNMSEIIIIEKNKDIIDNNKILACPICKKPLLYHNHNYFCENCLLAYPIINDIPVLNKEYGILCSKYMEF